MTTYLTGHVKAGGAIVTTFALTLAQMRTARAVSQARLAQRVHVDHSYISRLESGERNPSRDTCERIAVALSLDTADRIELLKAAGFDAGHQTTHPLAVRLDHALSAMEGDERVMVEQLVDGVLRLVSWRDGAPVLRRIA